MKDAREKEIGRILNGLVRYEDGFVKAATGIGDVHFGGSFSGAGLISLFGLFSRAGTYAVPKKKKDAQKVRDIFADLGTPVMLDSTPDVKAVICPSYLFNTALLTLGEDEKGFVITYYAYRNLLNGVNFRRQIKRLRKKLEKTELSEINGTATKK